MSEFRLDLRTMVALASSMMISLTPAHASGGSMMGGGGPAFPPSGGGGSYPKTPMIPPQIFMPNLPQPPTRGWIGMDPTDGHWPKRRKPDIRLPVPIPVGPILDSFGKHDTPRPPAVSLPPPPAVGPAVDKVKNVGKKAASTMGRAAKAFAGKAAVGAALGAGALRQGLAKVREARREPAPEPHRPARKSRKKSLPPLPATPIAAKLDPRLSSVPDEQMVMVMIRGEARGLHPDDSKNALAGGTIAPGNERSHLLRTEATRNLNKVLEELRQQQLAYPNDIPGYELNWLLNGVVVMARARVARKLAALGDVNYVLLDAPVTLATPKSRKVAPAGQASWGLAKMNVPSAWKEGALGEGVTIGIIDTGADAAHKDLAGRIVKFRDFTKPGGPEETAYDDEGHGTHCAGIIAGGNAQGSAIGVAPKAQLLVAKAMDKSGSGTLTGLVSALQWMADPDGNPATHDQPTAVSISWGSDPGLPVASTMFWDAISSLRSAGVLPIVASGNWGQDKVAIPGAFPHIYAVGATTQQDQVADITSRGNVTWQGVAYAKPNVSAPGDEVYSAVPGDKYEWMTGTSQAAPAVAGVAALVKSVNPALTGPQIEELINRSSSDLGTPGADATFGAGRVDAQAAVAAAKKLANAPSAKAP
jgi:subtilisin family serine protease